MPAAEKMDAPKKVGRTTTKQVDRKLPADVKLNTWQQAATLTERLSALRADQTGKLDFDPKQAGKALQRWQEQPPFNKDDFFEQRLAIDGMSEAEFRQLLGTPSESLSKNLPDAEQWQLSFNEAFAQFSSRDSQPLPLPEKIRESKISGFLTAVSPLIQRAIQQVQQGVERLAKDNSELPFDPRAVVDLCFVNLPGRLLGQLNSTLVLEVNIARIQGDLKGDTSEERFDNFVERLREPEFAMNLFEEYPVLARQLTITIDHWVRFSLEFLSHLSVDWQALQSAFYDGKEIGLLTELKGGAGDSHRGGRTVMIAKFSSGFQLVYKPRSLAIDLHFQELLTWLNERGDHAPFYILKTVEREHYGWVEFLGHKTCTSTAAVHLFYARQGGYLALLYVLQSSDFHLENLIAAGEHPVLIDLETLLLPHLKQKNSEQANQLAGEALFNDSVMCVMLLPHRVWATEQSKGVEFSGMGGAPGQLSPFETPDWRDIATDAMHVVRSRQEMPGSQNRPSLNGEDVDLLDYADSFINGFTSIYNLLIKYRVELLADNGPLARFENVEIRMVLRATKTYANILTESQHPDALRDGLDRDRLIDRLWADIEYRPDLQKVFHFERADLHQGDVPIFLTRPTSIDIWNSRGQRLSGFFEEAGLARVRSCLQKLGETDLKKQIWIIRSSMAVMSTAEHEHKPVHTTPTEPETAASEQRLLAAAEAVGDRLAELAFRSEQDASWVGLSLDNELLPSGTSLYDGLPGMALFLAYLGDITGEERHAELARAAITNLEEQLQNEPSPVTSIGGFSGWGGIIYTYTLLSKLWNQPGLLQEAEKFANLIPDLIEKDEVFDIIGGAAGCIGALLALHRCAPSETVLKIAIQCGDHLIARAKKMEHGLGWASPGEDKTPLTGFSHGAAGIAWALLELAAVSSEDRFRSAALQAIEYERSLFSPEMGNWPDLRDPELFGEVTEEGVQNYSMLWCHGAPGIGLGRLRTLSQLDDKEIRAEINAALKSTSEHGFGGNHCLCHGDLGNIELFVQAADILHETEWQQQVERLSALILASIEQHGWQSGVPLGVETPGFMCGLAGIGYGLLRLAHPERVPAVLVLEPPRGLQD